MKMQDRLERIKELAIFVGCVGILIGHAVGVKFGLWAPIDWDDHHGY